MLLFQIWRVWETTLHNGFQLGFFMSPICPFSMVNPKAVRASDWLHIGLCKHPLTPCIGNSAAPLPSSWFPVGLSKKGGCLVRRWMLCFDHALQVLLNLGANKHLNLAQIPCISAFPITIFTSAALPSPLPPLLASTAALYVANRTWEIPTMLGLPICTSSTRDTDLQVQNLPARYQSDLWCPDRWSWTRFVLRQDQNLITKFWVTTKQLVLEERSGFSF